MVTRSAGRVQWALVLVALAAIAASGHGLAWAQTARNETAASDNGETLDALLSTTSRAFSRSKCIESIRIMKHVAEEGSYPSIDISVPADNTLTPPGAEEWCNCLRDNEPLDGIPSDYEGVFNTCRDKVLIGSDFNAMDICRGMVKLYNSWRFWYSYTTFCSRRLCPNRDGFGDYNYPSYWEYERDAYDLWETCGAGCVSDVAAGYCAKYRLTYGGFIFRRSYRYSETFRRIAVDGRFLSQRQFSRFSDWGSSKVQAAEAMCNLLYPTDQAKCCTYARGYSTLSQCCYVKNGALEFNCSRSYGGARLRYNCMKLGSRSFYGLATACNALIGYYVAHPTYQQAKLAKIPGGQTSVVFPEAFMDDFCDSKQLYDIYVDGQYDFTPGTREYCCNKMNTLFGELVENCLPGAGTYTSRGAARLPPSVVGTPPTTPEPTPSPSPTTPPASCDACSHVDDNGACKSVCKNTEECTVRNGNAFCVRCDFFRRDFPDGKNRQCCELRVGDSGTLCQTKVNNKSEKNKCFTDEGPWTNNKGVEKNPQPYTIDAVQNVCNSRDNFWVNRKLCKVTDKANGEKQCEYIKKKDRDSILAGR